MTLLPHEYPDTSNMILEDDTPLGLCCTNILESLHYKTFALIIFIDKSLFHNASSTFMQQSPPLDSFINEKQQCLLTTVFYSGVEIPINAPYSSKIGTRNA
ncbi:hypothetical protein ACP6PL_03730 [Dapis sp. BLCC M126]|uniref:hypothetical protein n=1 Tax=Dapis sp. BLCC M126 TaxID=3400189 RepID=UPI003CF84C5A